MLSEEAYEEHTSFLTCDLNPIAYRERPFGPEIKIIDRNCKTAQLSSFKLCDF